MSSHSIQRKLKRNMNRQMENLQEHIVKEQNLAVQVTDLRETKAALTARLQGNEDALAEARQVIMNLQAKEQSLCDQLVGLKAEVLSFQEVVRETQAIKSHLHQSELRSSELEAEVARLSNSFAMQASLLEEGNGKVKALQDNAVLLELQVKEGETKASKLEEEKAACDVRVNEKYESLKSQLLQTENAERKSFKKEQAKTLLGMQRKEAVLEGIAKKLEEEVKELKVARAREVKKLVPYPKSQADYV